MNSTRQFGRLHPWALPLSFALLLLAGCATPSPQAALPVVRTQLAGQADVTDAWPVTPEERAAAGAAVHDLLAAELTVDSAVRIALLNNRGLRATFEELGLSQAGLAAATRLPNPSFDASVRWPRDTPRGPNVEFGFSLPLLESFLLPARRQVAESQLLQTQYRVSHEVLALVAEVRRAAYEVLARQELREQFAGLAETAEAAVDVARRQFEAGNIAQLDLLQFQNSAQQSQLELTRAGVQLGAAREQLNRLLGLSAGQTAWKMNGALPPLPARDALPDDPEAAALAQRLDLAALRTQAELAQKAHDLKRRTRLLPGETTLGVATERDPDGSRVTGPHVAVQLPLFDQGQPELARLAAEMRQAGDRAEALAAAIGSETRLARDALAAARQTVEFHQQTLRPQRRALLRETLLHYNAMQKSVYELLAAKEQLQITERQGVEALRDYWLARTELERALGRRLPDGAETGPVAKPAELSAPPAKEPHHPAHK